MANNYSIFVWKKRINKWTKNIDMILKIKLKLTKHLKIKLNHRSFLIIIISYTLYKNKILLKKKIINNNKIWIWFDKIISFFCDIIFINYEINLCIF